ncbi:MAG: crotonobetainyl-CoA:carnitine CoA-transferase CaiB-like acyl-CoA transferase [Paraglaciecola sp.]|jgi:crotonobetainyl-CoA:carnitine CoA-transferase CaiB-like acyl-CoA transferase
MELQSFFKDLKIVELASVLAGPAVGMFFAELGAKVIKIENKKTGGDVTRRWRLPSENAERDYSAYYCSVNFGKESLMLDLGEDADKKIALEVIQDADIVVSNFKHSSAKKMGLDYENVCKINPSVIFAHLSGYGEGDNRPAFDVVLQAEAGFLFMCGEPDREPVKMPVALIDILAAHQLKEGILIALLNRFKTGKGALVSTSLLESAIASLANQATNYLMANHIPQRMGAQHPNIAPYGDIFYTKDEKPLVLAIGTERQFYGLCTALETPSLANHVDFKTNALRVKKREELKVILMPIFKKYTRKELLERFKIQQVPGGSIRDMAEVFEMEKAKEMILENEMPDGNIAKRVRTVAFEVK